MSQSSSNANIKFAYWMPNASDGLVVSAIPQRTDWSLEYNQELARTVEKAGFDYVLSQIRFTAGYDTEHQYESISFSQAILYATTRPEMLAAILLGPWHPAVVAKQLATTDHISNGCIAINVVSDWFRGEFQALDKPWLEHGEHYYRSNEFIRALKGIWMQDKFAFKGDFYRVNDYILNPKPLQKPHPEIFQGGGSRAARDSTASASDWYFASDNTPEGAKAWIDDIQAKARENSHTVRIDANTFIIVRDTEEETRAVLGDIIKRAHVEAVYAFGDTAKRVGKASLEGEGNWVRSMFEDLIQYNDGLRINLIGTSRQIAERAVHLKSIGVDLVLTGFLHFTEEVEYFGRKVLPPVRELEV